VTSREKEQRGRRNESCFNEMEPAISRARKKGARLKRLERSAWGVARVVLGEAASPGGSSGKHGGEEGVEKGGPRETEKERAG